jgi:hypothetical protein
MTHFPLPTADATTHLAGTASTTTNLAIKTNSSAEYGLSKSSVATESAGPALVVSTLPEQPGQPSHSIQDISEESTKDETAGPEHRKRWEQAAGILALAALRAAGLKVPQAPLATPTT